MRTKYDRHAQRLIGLPGRLRRDPPAPFPADGSVSYRYAEPGDAGIHDLAGGAAWWSSR